MPAGMPYFAWIDPGETTFGPEHMRWDENIFSFTLKQDEGDPASLTVVVRRPRNVAGDPIGLLGPGRKIWTWFSIDCGGAEVVAPPAAPTEWLTTSFTPGPDRNDFDGEAGIRIGIGTADIPITWLGVRCHPGNSGTRKVNLYEWFTRALVVTATVDLTGKPANEYVWIAIPPTTLLANGYYALMMEVSNGMQPWANSGPTTLRSDLIVNVYDSYAIGVGGALATGVPNSQFVGLNLGWGSVTASASLVPRSDGINLVKFRGRLVGVPTSIIEELVTLEFVARPIDLVAQKDALAQTLRVLPYYDEVVIDKNRRTDPDVVLEGYSAIWHYDRETHVLTVSDEITGEDGLVEFDGASEDGKVLYDGLGLTLTSGPLARVDVKAEFTWTQQAQGKVDLTQYLVANWPNEPAYATPGTITSFSFTADNWPKAGAGLGDGWKAAETTAHAVYDLEVHTNTVDQSAHVVVKGYSITASETFSRILVPPGSIPYGEIVTRDEGSATESTTSRNYAATSAVLPLNHTRPTLLAGYTAARPCTERVLFSLVADVQHVLTDPEDGEALRIDDVRSVNLSEPIGEGTGAYVPIGDPRRRSYIATARGNQSLEHLIALARAYMMKRARVVEIAFAPKLARMPEVTLRKNAFLAEPRVGEALGKIIGYSLALDGSDGRINCEVRIGCAIGRGGSAIASGGEPTYCEIAYTGADYQQFTGRTSVLFDSSVGYQPPNADPNDDGIDFLSALGANDVIDTGLSVENPPAMQRAHLATVIWPGGALAIGSSPETVQDSVAARAEAVNNALKQVETSARFKLKSMSREFATDYEIQITDLKIPAGYDLEAV
jgi:hypothetical protein